MRRLKMGVIGCGAIAQIQHLPHLRELSDEFEIAGLCDISPRLLAAVGDDFGVPPERRYADYEAMEMAQGMYLSVTCNDYGQHEKLADAKVAQSKIRAVLQDERSLEGEFGDCDIWPKRASEPTVQEPARYAGPVLVIGGDEDPATPVEWAKHAASTLSASTR